jgi:hypothetical protein
MTVHRVVYSSRPFGYDAAMLGGILLAARRNNRRDDVTGALICRSDIYLQLLEGPRAAVTAAFDRIACDDRHLDVEPLFAGDVAERLFPAWAMLDDPAKSWLWSRADVAAGPPDARAATGVFERLASAACGSPPNG